MLKYCVLKYCVSPDVLWWNGENQIHYCRIWASSLHSPIPLRLPFLKQNYIQKPSWILLCTSAFWEEACRVYAYKLGLPANITSNCLPTKLALPLETVQSSNQQQYPLLFFDLRIVKTLMFWVVIETTCLKKLVKIEKGKSCEPYVPQAFLAQTCKKLSTCLCK